MIKVLIVDDSAFMRIVIRKMIASDPKISIVGEARTGAQAVQMAQALRPDVITMDVEMPEMDGVKATQAIMASAPCAIIMVSSLTERGAQTTIQALTAGAVDFIAKKSSFVQLDLVQIADQLLEKIHLWFNHRASLRLKPSLAGSTNFLPDAKRTVAPVGKIGLVVVGVSTGGPAMMSDLLISMGPIACPMVIAQHMPALFTSGYADHLRSQTGLNVVEGRSGLPLESAMVVIAPGGIDCFVREPFTGKLSLYLKIDEKATIHPNADVLFRSAATTSVAVVGVVLTGMGEDGTEGARALVARNAPVLVQEGSTCVVDGMPSSVIKAGLASQALSPKALGKQLAKWCK